MMKGKLGILSDKEAKALLEGTVSSLQKKGKRKRPALLDTGVMNDPEGYKQSKAEAASAPTTQTGVLPASLSSNPSPAKSTKRAKSKSSEGKGTLTVSLPAARSAYSDPSFVIELSKTLLLPVDCKRLADIGLVQSVE